MHSFILTAPAVIEQLESFGLVTFTLRVVLCFSLVTAARLRQLTTPLLILMVQNELTIHGVVKELAADCSFGQAVCLHVTSVNPKQPLDNMFVEQLT